MLNLTDIYWDINKYDTGLNPEHSSHLPLIKTRFHSECCSFLMTLDSHTCSTGEIFGDLVG